MGSFGDREEKKHAQSKAFPVGSSSIDLPEDLPVKQRKAAAKSPVSTACQADL